jgi:hypothetical protein
VAVVSQPSRRVAPAPGAPGRARAAERPRARSQAPAARIRWDRVARVAMLFTLVVLLYLAISPVRSLISDFHLSAQRQAQLRQLERQGAELAAQEHALSLPGTRSLEARNLGLLRPGEHGYVVYGLPDN